MLTLRGYEKPVQALAFSADGGTLLSADGANNIRVFDLPAGRLRWETTGGFFGSIVFTPNGQQVVTSHWGVSHPIEGRRRRSAFDRENPVQIRDAATGTPTPAPLRNDRGLPLAGLRFTPDGRRCLGRIGHDNLNVSWWEFPSGARLPDWSPDPDTLWYADAAAIAPDGRTLAGVNTAGLSVFDLPAGSLRFHHPFKLVMGDVRLAYHPNGRRLAYASGTRAAIFDLESRTDVVEIKQATKHVLGLAFTPDGRRLATVSNEATVKLWDAATGGLATEYAWAVGGLRCVAFAPDGSVAAAGGTGKKVVVWDLDG